MQGMLVQIFKGLKQKSRCNTFPWDRNFGILITSDEKLSYYFVWREMENPVTSVRSVLFYFGAHPPGIVSLYNLMQEHGK